MMKRILFSLLLTLVLPFSISAQDFLDLVRTEVNFEKRALVAEAMDIPSSQSIEFWNTYSNFETEIDRLGDQRIANIKKFADNFENMSDKVADEIAGTYFTTHQGRYKVYKKYYKKFSKTIGSKKAVRFYQIMDQIQLLIDIQIASEEPLIE
jgi:hypothetical protein